jgi:hypothetical protein
MHIIKGVGLATFNQVLDERGLLDNFLFDLEDLLV